MPFVRRPACPTCGTEVEIFFEQFGARGCVSAAVYPSVRDTLAPLLLPQPAISVAGSAQPMVLLTHGFGSGSLLWQAQVPALVAQGYHVVTWDMRGHARSSSPANPACYSKQHQIDDMTAVVAAAAAAAAAERGDSGGATTSSGGGRGSGSGSGGGGGGDGGSSSGGGGGGGAAAAAVARHQPEGPALFLVGHSMGGYDNLLYYFAHADRVGGLVLYGTGPGFASDSSRLKWNETAEKMASACVCRSTSRL